MAQVKVKAAAGGGDEAEANCPMAPHKKPKEFTAKAPKVKEVAELRRNMKAGTSTQAWVEKGDEVDKGTNKTSENPEPTFPGDKPPIQIEDRGYPLSVAAHHLIPGKESLPVSAIKRYVWAKHGEIENDIGYDVDGAENGIWLPTHQALSRGAGKAQTIIIHEEENPLETKPGLSYRKLSRRAKSKRSDPEAFTTKFIPLYTQQAMKKMERQFHDSHSVYSRHVKKRLGKLAVKLDNRIGFCDECKTKGKPYPPPFRLVFKLNNISDYYQGKLKGPPSMWDKTVYTSYWALHYMDNPVID